MLGFVVFGESVVLWDFFYGGSAAETGVDSLQSHHVSVFFLLFAWLFGEEGLSDREIPTVVVLDTGLGFSIFLDLPLLLDAGELLPLNLSPD